MLYVLYSMIVLSLCILVSLLFGKWVPHIGDENSPVAQSSETSIQIYPDEKVKYVDISKSILDETRFNSIYALNSIDIEANVTLESVDNENGDGKDGDRVEFEEKKLEENETDKKEENADENENKNSQEVVDVVGECYIEIWYPIRLIRPRSMENMSRKELRKIETSKQFIHTPVRTKTIAIYSNQNKNKLKASWSGVSDDGLSMLCPILHNYASDQRNNFGYYCTNNQIRVFLVIKAKNDGIILNELKSTISTKASDNYRYPFDDEPFRGRVLNDIEIIKQNSKNWEDNICIKGCIGCFEMAAYGIYSLFEWCCNCCGSEPEEPRELVLEKELKIDRRIEKILLLGPQNTGKSTIFKQLRAIYGQGITERDLMNQRDNVYSQAIEQMQYLLSELKELMEEDEEKYNDLKLSDEGEAAATFMDNVKGDSDVTDDIAANIELLWKEKGIQKLFEMKRYFGSGRVQECDAHFFDDIRRIGKANYIPTHRDYILRYWATTGIVEEKFDIKGTIFHIFDVGGRNNERKKWIHCFEHVSVVIFVTSLIHYIKPIYDWSYDGNDGDKKAIFDSLDLFDQMIHLRWFIETTFILFLNKNDLFKETIKKHSLKECFDDYNGNDIYDDGIEFIQSQYVEKSQNKDKPIYCHVTCAIDKDMMEKVFNDVQHIVIHTSLAREGLI